MYFKCLVIGREISMRNKQIGNHLVPCASLLALNSLVAEYLYTQNCQFTLSVFATEVSFPNALPDFYSDPVPYRFSVIQQQDLLRSFGVTQEIESDIRKQYLTWDTNSQNTSLLFTMLQSMCSAAKPDNGVALRMASKSSQTKIKYKPIHQSNKLFFRNRKLLHRVHSHLNALISNIMQIMKTIETVPSKKHVQHIISKLHRKRQYLERLPIKHKLLKKIVDSTCRLSSELESLVDMLNIKKGPESETINLDNPIITSQTSQYCDWVQELKNSANGKRFLQHIIKHYKNERQIEIAEHQKKLSEEIKLERARLKHLYKQRFLNRCSGLVMLSSENAEAPSTNYNQPFDKTSEIVKTKTNSNSIQYR